MSARENFVSIEGNLTATPELRFTPSGKAVANLSIAQSDRRLVDGQWVDGPVSYFDCVAWDRLAEHAVSTLNKGDRVTITGALKQRSWEDRDTGAKRYKVEIVVDNINVSLRFATASIMKATFGGRDADETPVSPAYAAASAGGRDFEPVEEPF